MGMGELTLGVRGSRLYGLAMVWRGTGWWATPWRRWHKVAQNTYLQYIAKFNSG